MTDRPVARRTISSRRKGLYSMGVVLQILGGVGFLVCFLGFAMGGQAAVRSHGQEGSPMQWWVGGVVCAVAIAAGGVLRTLAARGVAGAGLVLDPDRARQDLEPWARAGGGLLKDAVEEAGLARGEGERVAVRCRGCRTLNDEDAKFCDHCGAAL